MKALKKNIPNEAWEDFKSKMYDAAEKSDLVFRWEWQITNPKDMQNIREISCARIGKHMFMFQVFDQGFLYYKDVTTAKLDDIVNELFPDIKA